MSSVSPFSRGPVKELVTGPCISQPGVPPVPLEILARLNRLWHRSWLGALFKDTRDVAFSVKHGNDLERRGFRKVDNRVVGIARDRPETHGARCQVGPKVTGYDW